MELTAQIEPPVTYAPLLHSGIEVVDHAWGGLYRGGSYLVYGRAASGRDLLTLRFTQLGADLGESCLFISPQRPKDLMIQAASIGFDLRGAYEAGLVKLLRIPPTMAYQGSEDDGILRAMRDLVALIRQHRPQRLVVNDFMPFVLFRSFDRLKAAVVDLLEHTDVLDMTMLLVMSEPGNEQSKRIVEFVGSQMTGTIRLEMIEDQPESTRRRIMLTPNIGHVRGTRSEMFDLGAMLVTPTAEARPRMPLLPSTAASSAPPAPPVYRGIRLGGPADDAGESGGGDPLARDAEASHVAPSSPRSYNTPFYAGMPRQATELPSIPVFPTSLGTPPAAPAPQPAPVMAVPVVPAVPAPSPAPPVPDAYAPEAYAAPAYPPFGGAQAPYAPPVPPQAPPQPAPPQQAPPSYPPMPAYGAPQAPPAAPQPFGGGQSPYGAPPSFDAPQAPYASPAPVLSAPQPAPQPMATPQPMAAAQPVPAPAPRRGAETTGDRMTFARLLDEQFRQRVQQGVPFLLVAMRLDTQAMQPLGFEFISDAVGEALRPQDALLLDPRASRLVALLTGANGEESGAFFTRLKARMREEAPAHAEALLRAVEAVVIPNGDPFKTADAVLAYVLDNA